MLSLVDWPVFPRFEAHYAEISMSAQFGADTVYWACCGAGGAHPHALRQAKLLASETGWAGKSGEFSRFGPIPGVIDAYKCDPAWKSDPLMEWAPGSGQRSGR